MATTKPSVPDFTAGLDHLRQVEPRFAPLIDRHGPPLLIPTRDPFASLGSAIIHQQLAGAAARTIHGRFVALFGRRAFPTPAALAASRSITCAPPASRGPRRSRCSISPATSPIAG